MAASLAHGSNSGNPNGNDPEDDLDTDNFHVSSDVNLEYPDWVEYEFGNGQIGYLGCITEYDIQTCSSHHFFQLNKEKQKAFLLAAYDHYHKPGDPALALFFELFLEGVSNKTKVPGLGIPFSMAERSKDQKDYSEFRSLLTFYLDNENDAPLSIHIVHGIEPQMGYCYNDSAFCAEVSEVTLSVDGNSLSFVLDSGYAER